MGFRKRPLALIAMATLPAAAHAVPTKSPAFDCGPAVGGTGSVLDFKWGNQPLVGTPALESRTHPGTYQQFACPDGKLGSGPPATFDIAENIASAAVNPGAGAAAAGTSLPVAGIIPQAKLTDGVEDLRILLRDSNRTSIPWDTKLPYTVQVINYETVDNGVKLFETLFNIDINLMERGPSDKLGTPGKLVEISDFIGIKIESAGGFAGDPRSGLDVIKVKTNTGTTKIDSLDLSWKQLGNGDLSFYSSPESAPVPEPASVPAPGALGLLGTGLAGLALRRRAAKRW